MVGVGLRMCFDMLAEDQKHQIRELCEKYGVKPECMYPGGEVENMSFDFGDDELHRDEFSDEIFGDDELHRDEFSDEMEVILDVKSHGTKRRVFGHRIQCPL